MAFSFLDPVFSPILSLPPLWAIILVSGVLSALLTLIYKWTTDQNLMKALKEEIATLQKELKELKNDPEKALHVQKKAMEANMKYMMESLKPTLFTFIPIILIFGWLSGHYAYEPIKPNTEFLVTAHFSGAPATGINLAIPEGSGLTASGALNASITANKAEWGLKAAREGKQYLSFAYGNQTIKKTVIISNQREYEEPATIVNEGNLADITTHHEELIVFNLFGWKLGWLGSYIIFSIIFSLLSRKAFNVY